MKLFDDRTQILRPNKKCIFFQIFFFYVFVEFFYFFSDDVLAYEKYVTKNQIDQIIVK